MALVLKKKHRWRVIGVHAGLLAFIALMVFPFLMIVSISLRPGNFAGGSILEPAARRRVSTLRVSFQAICMPIHSPFR